MRKSRKKWALLAPRNERYHGWGAWMPDEINALPFTRLNSKLISPFGRGYNWMGDHLRIASRADSHKNAELT